jgi:hypothetical protein
MIACEPSQCVEYRLQFPKAKLMIELPGKRLEIDVRRVHTANYLVRAFRRQPSVTRMSISDSDAILRRSCRPFARVGEKDNAVRRANNHGLSPRDVSRAGFPIKKLDRSGKAFPRPDFRDRVEARRTESLRTAKPWDVALQRRSRSDDTRR